MVSFVASLLIGTHGWKSDNFEVILHRSAGMVAPENTVPALEAAVRQGADGIEIDIRRTVDGHFVLYHDDWMLDTLGAGVKVEDLTLAEVRDLDIGARWGSQWRGLRVPLLSDVLEFARVNRLLLYYDIKTPNIDAELRALTDKAQVADLVIFPERLASPNRPKLDWVSGWNYLDGGEEDVSKIQALVEHQGGKPVRFMVDDARAFSIALKRNPAHRRFVPYRETSPPASERLAADLKSPDKAQVRRGIWRQAQSPAAGAWPRVRELVESDDPHLALDAIWAMGASSNPEDTVRLRRLGLKPSTQDPRNHPSGMPYFDTYRLAAVACSLVRQNSAAAHEALRGIAAEGGFASQAVTVAYTAHGQSDHILAFIGTVESPKAPELGFALQHAARHPFAREIYRVALGSGGMVRRNAVFGLAALHRERPEIARLADLMADSNPQVRSGATLAQFWADFAWPAQSESEGDSESVFAR
ncbi:MAG: glycerophosphodiester phosphodiesterase family protein [Fimbriimonadaceae bacterium]